MRLSRWGNEGGREEDENRNALVLSKARKSLVLGVGDGRVVREGEGEGEERKMEDKMFVIQRQPAVIATHEIGYVLIELFPRTSPLCLTFRLKIKLDASSPRDHGRGIILPGFQHSTETSSTPRHRLSARVDPSQCVFSPSHSLLAYDFSPILLKMLLPTPL